MLEMLIVLAQAADSTDGLPAWAKYILGPLGALALLGIYAWHTEKKRIPQVIEQIKQAQKELTQLRDDHKKELETVREKGEAEERRLEDEIQKWRDKHTKERTTRAWWQSKAEDFAKRLGEESGIPPDIDKTYYQGD